MGKDSAIEWCDHTFNPWIGCSKVSPGCKNCYAEGLMDHRMKQVQWGPGKPRKRTSAANWKKVEQWNRLAATRHHEYRVYRGNGVQISDLESALLTHRPRVFCASLADWLDPEVPLEWLADLLDLIRRTPHLDWLLLTKRPELWRERLGQLAIGFQEPSGQIPPPSVHQWVCDWVNGLPPANVWIGTSVEDQTRANERIPHLLKIPATVRFLSCEPLLGPVNLNRPLIAEGVAGRPGIDRLDATGLWLPRIHWVICGGESGPNARPMHPDWARSLRDQCAASDVPFFFKQWGEWLPVGQHLPGFGKVHGATAVVPGRMKLHYGGSPKQAPQHAFSERGVPCVACDGQLTFCVGKKAAGRLLDGVEHNEFPEVHHA